MPTGPAVLLIGVRPGIADLLVRRLGVHVRPLVVSIIDCLRAEYDIPDCRISSGKIHFSSGTSIQLEDIAGTYAEGIFDVGLTGSDPVLLDLLNSELTALIGYLRLSGRNCPNPPSGGAFAPFCGPLLDQWAFVNALSLDVRVPSWCLADAVSALPTKMLIDPFDYRFPIEREFGHPAIRVNTVRGRRAVCLFCGDRQWHVVQESIHDWRPVATTDRFRDQVASLIQGVRERFSLDVGSINYFYSGCFTFWSVNSIPDVERFSSAIQDEFLGALCARLTAGLDRPSLSRGASTRRRSITRQHRRSVREVPIEWHPLLDGSKARLRTATTDKGSLVYPAPSSRSPYVSVVSSEGDRTARHLVAVARRRKRNVHWVTYESLAEFPGNYERVRDEFATGNGGVRATCDDNVRRRSNGAGECMCCRVSSQEPNRTVDRFDQLVEATAHSETCERRLRLCHILQSPRMVPLVWTL